MDRSHERGIWGMDAWLVGWDWNGVGSRDFGRFGGFFGRDNGGMYIGLELVRSLGRVGRGVFWRFFFCGVGCGGSEKKEGIHR